MRGNFSEGRSETPRCALNNTVESFERPVSQNKKGRRLWELGIAVSTSGLASLGL